MVRPSERVPKAWMIEVHREYLMWTAIYMVGSIGGQLGLWVGFSFAGFLSGFMSKLTTVWHTSVQNNKQRIISFKDM